MGKNFESVVDQSNRYLEEPSTKYPGAYKEGIKVLALMRDNIEWRLAEIYAIRPAKFFAEQICNDSEEDYPLNDDISVLNHPDDTTK